ncbi:exonuclease domain-containing protein [Methylobacterium indicum]|uniref:exonuclease domain-containing protein n=1 Tax=Methylobacterium indicum TaxID=1775910 RepID=UPI00073458A8|nr:exonuclease domain-containing protein [Methylobacterium indicum]
MKACPGEPYFAHAMTVCSGLDFRAIAAISLDARWDPEGLAAAGVREDDLVVEPLLRRAAELGHIEAQFSLGALHAGGVFVDYDDLEALRWYRKAAEQGHPEAAYQIVKYLRLDPADHRMTHAPVLDDNELERLLAIAATGHRIEADFLHGVLLYDRHEDGRSPGFRERPGYRSIRQAAVQAYRPAMERLAEIHAETGDRWSGARWLRAAAQVAFLDADDTAARSLAVRSVRLDRSGSDEDEDELTSVLSAPVVELDWNAVFAWRGGGEAAFRMASRVAEETGGESAPAGWLRFAADFGHATAAMALGDLLDDEWIWEDDLDAGVEAAALFAKAAQLGAPGALEKARKAALQLGEHFEAEDGPEAEEEAQRWFEKAAALGCPEGAYVMGWRLLQPGPRHDPVRGFPALLASAEAGFPAAAWEVAECLRTGVGVARDPARALAWYRRAADHDFVAAKLHLGRAYRDGSGVEVDLGQALSWLALAADGGDADARYGLGLIHLEGLGTPADPEAALRWLRAAADDGHAPSLAKIAELERAPAEPGERFVVIDFETSGLSPNKGDRVIEVGAVEIVDGRIGRCFQSLANPGFPVSARITTITGITNAMLADAPPLAAVMREVSAFIAGATLIAHNAPFDRRFLRAEMERLDLWDDREVLCTLQLGKRAYPGLGSYKLALLAEHAGVQLPDAMHRALADAMATAELFLVMREWEGRPPSETEPLAIAEPAADAALLANTLPLTAPRQPDTGWRRWLPAFG